MRSPVNIEVVVVVAVGPPLRFQLPEPRQFVPAARLPGVARTQVEFMNTWALIDRLVEQRRAGAKWCVETNNRLFRVLSGRRSQIEFPTVEVDGVDEVLLIAETARRGLDPLNP